MLRRAVADGVVTGFVLGGGVVGLCSALGRSLERCSEWLFVAGVAIVAMSAVWTIGGYISPPGVLGVFSGEAEVYPSAPKDSLWIDRFIHPRNIWLVAGLLMVAASYLLVL